MMSKLLQQEYLTTRKALAAMTGWLLLVGVVSLVPVAIPMPYVNNVGFLLAIVSFSAIARQFFSPTSSTTTGRRCMGDAATSL